MLLDASENLFERLTGINFPSALLTLVIRGCLLGRHRGVRCPESGTRPIAVLLPHLPTTSDHQHHLRVWASDVDFSSVDLLLRWLFRMLSDSVVLRLRQGRCAQLSAMQTNPRHLQPHVICLRWVISDPVSFVLVFFLDNSQPPPPLSLSL
uniref:LITAF domain-containing protein n=1 Tax=Mesocestoides corti TaxID=53468 RepID=A0A5K3ERJ7_MESCO